MADMLCMLTRPNYESEIPMYSDLMRETVQKPLTAEASKKTDEQPKTPSSPMKAKTTIAPEAGEFL